ncbi:aldehyde dehydrogenase family protein [Actinomadura sp. HBU206391]|uniref:aldehyde dehydrogenase family protein n=1 Tax=Actinomadura sp. HBU206391 TaxID=2731692 RepID=UPI0016509DED|nr:aldehyde dehydrogenase family protein [Actinomadura sp. HBU206391]MBC6459600.1 aldehyde dehydrogenase family protein [Actinomadura sp. HBU206391]
MPEITPFYLSGVPTTGSGTLPVTSPWDGSVVGLMSVPTDAQVEQAVADLDAVRAEAQAMPAHARAGALDHISARLKARAEEIATLITAENGKPLFWSRGEVARAVATFRWAAEETRRFSGDLQRLDTEVTATGRLGVVRRFPRGPVLGIAPFNFPLNLVAHKVAPAIAVGAPILVKPAPATPLTAMLLGEIIAETELPAGMVSVLPVPNDRMAPLVADPRLPVVSFTGSGPVGWAIREQAPRKHLTLELGGDAAVVVNDDWPDLTGAAERIALFANYQAGQSCISVQRVLVHTDVYDAFVTELVTAVEKLPTGDPTAEGVLVGPVINEAAAERIVAWVEEARDAGASVLTGGTHEGTAVAPTVLSGVPAGIRVAEEEIFGPVLTVAQFTDLDEAFTVVNSSRYGLQAGIFTTDVRVAFRAHRDLEVGGLIVGDVPSYRADQMPYGGWKESGIGREGVRSAMNDLTEERVLVLTGLDL